MAITITKKVIKNTKLRRDFGSVIKPTTLYVVKNKGKRVEAFLDKDKALNLVRKLRR